MTKREIAKAFIEEALNSGPRRYMVLVAQAEARGIAGKDLDSVARALNVIAYHLHNQLWWRKS